MTAFYEPWQPRLGQRVLLVGSGGECPHGTPGNELARGQTGVIAEIDEHKAGAGPGHHYRVLLDRPEVLPADLHPLGGPWCAALELEPLERSSDQ